jgi:Domain of unknown function (DUF6457)
MSTLDNWTEAVVAELGVDPPPGFARVVLDLARDAAHQVERPAAPVTAFLLGVAVGHGKPLAETAGKLQDLAAGWPASAE